MPIRNNKSVTPIPGIYVKSKDALHDALIEFDNASAVPTTTTSSYYLYVYGGVLYYDNGVSAVALSSGGGGTPTWDTIYAIDQTMTISGNSMTYNLTHATGDGLTITSGAVAGQLIQLTNSGTGDDIQGTSDTWAVTKAGLATFTGIDGCDSLTAAAGLVLEASGANTISVGATSSGAIDIGTGGGAVTIASAATLSSTLAVATGITCADGIVDFVDNSNVASSLRVTNDTTTTYGNASDAGMVVFRSESLTTGALLHLSADETSLAGGFFLRAWSQDLAGAAFTIGEYGVTVITGPAAGGSDAFTITAGDVEISDGAVKITDADNAASLTVTNATATTASGVVVVVADAVSTGNVVDINADGLTSGNILHLDSTSAGVTTGKFIDCYDGAASVLTIAIDGATVIAGTASGTDVLTLTAGDATITSGDLTISEGSAVIVNTANEAALSITADSVTTGNVVEINADGLTSGTILHLDSTVAGLTTGLYIDCYDGAASDFSVGVAGATVIAGTATGTDALTITAGDITVTNGDITSTDGDLIFTANSSLITFTGTGANGGVIGNMKNHATSALSGTAKTVEISIGGAPYYFSVYPTKA